MIHNSKKLYLCSTAILVFIWFLSFYNLLIVDVWDETAGLLIISENHLPSIVYENIPITQEQIIFRRPLTGLIFYSILKLKLPYDVCWKLLRAMNAAFVLFSLFFLIEIIKYYKGKDLLQQLLLTAIFLFSGSSIITISWFANMYDASSLFLLALGLYLFLVKKHYKISSIILGLSFFCKETGILVYFMLILFSLTGFVSKQKLILAISISFFIGLIYFFIRSSFIPLGSSLDIHGFNLELLLPSLTGWLESFWWQNMKREEAEAAGWVFLLISIIAIRNGFAMISVIGILLFSGVLYWEMTANYQNHILLSSHNFIGRLYLIPFFFILLIIALYSHNILLIILAIPVLSGGFATYNDHYHFQKAYLNAYQKAHSAHKEILIKQDGIGIVFHDPKRKIKYGNLNTYHYYFDIKTGAIRVIQK